MPYQVYKTGARYCVHKKNPDGSKGKRIACHATMSKARAQQKALYAAENKEGIMTTNDNDNGQSTTSNADASYVSNMPYIGERIKEQQEQDEKGYYAEDSPVYSYVPWGVTSFAELEEAQSARAAALRIRTLSDQMVELTSNIMNKDEIEDKAAAVSKLADEYKAKINEEAKTKEAPFHDVIQDYYDLVELGIIDEETEDVVEQKEEGLEAIYEKAVWTTAYKNNLPDSAFLYIKPNCGSKDSEGKTKPRACRKFPVKDSNGKYDLAHMRNAIARIPQSKGVPAGKKKSLQARAQRILSGLKKEESSWLEQIAATVKETIAGIFDVKQEKQQSGFMLWKEDSGRLRWFTRYSNNFRDDDHPPEIISANSHRRFVGLVDRKEAPLPELWLWHVPEWKLGEADWLAYDDSGFALASGTIDRGKEMVAEQIAKTKLVGVSHGMPVSSIKRDPDDPTIIIEHETREISPLPPSNAANKLGEWVLLGNVKEGNNMPIPEQKKQDLLERWNIDAEVLEQLEALNAEDADKASEEGRESKETTEEQEKPAIEEQETEQPQDEAETEEQEKSTDQEEEPAPAPEDENPITREEIAEAITAVLTPYMEAVEQLRGEVKALQEPDEEKIAKAVSMTPTASVSALLAQKFSAIGDKSTQVAKNQKLAKAGPEEAPDSEQMVSPIPFLNELLTSKPQEE